MALDFLPGLISGAAAIFGGGNDTQIEEIRPTPQQLPVQDTLEAIGQARANSTLPFSLSPSRTVDFAAGLPSFAQQTPQFVPQQGQAVFDPGFGGGFSPGFSAALPTSGAFGGGGFPGVQPAFNPPGNTAGFSSGFPSPNQFAGFGQQSGLNQPGGFGPPRQFGQVQPGQQVGGQQVPGQQFQGQQFQGQAPANFQPFVQQPQNGQSPQTLVRELPQSQGAGTAGFPGAFQQQNNPAAFQQPNSNVLNTGDPNPIAGQPDLASLQGSVQSPTPLPSQELAEAFVPDIFRDPFVSGLNAAAQSGSFSAQALPLASAFQSSLFDPGLNAHEQSFLEAGTNLGLRALESSFNQIDSQYENTPFHTSRGRQRDDAANVFADQIAQQAGQLGIQRQQLATQQLPNAFNQPLQANQFAQQTSAGLFNLLDQTQRQDLQDAQFIFGATPIQSSTFVQTQS